ncbi:MAG: Xaa-Pro peptidase family protein [Methanomicrobiaceae archaeon]|nr:Xaa-Pro peptidase family protein [Methanomicrobiaceae archaeon]
MHTRVPSRELEGRMRRFRALMDARNPDWEMAAFFGKINLYYFTGTMQDGIVLIPRDDEAVFWVRRSYARAREESFFLQIRQMESFRDAAAATPHIPGTVHLETELVPIALLDRFRKHFPFREVRPLDAAIAEVRAVKSAYELSCMEKAGNIHRHVLEGCVPDLLGEGINEAAFAARLYEVLIEHGHHGVARFGMFDTEIRVGQIAFGENSLSPTCFNGPGGSRGLCPAVPLLGDRERKLRRGDLVFVDIGCGVEGYHTDKTMTYVFRGELPYEAVESHERCLAVQHEMAAMLRPGVAPSAIYETIMENLTPEFRENFMGFGDRRVKFLGHGVGLVIDELPVIAAGFDAPLQEGMVFALEPKKGIAGVGMVGVENTFAVTPQGGRSLTGDHPGLMPV